MTGARGQDSELVILKLGGQHNLCQRLNDL